MLETKTVTNSESVREQAGSPVREPARIATTPATLRVAMRAGRKTLQAGVTSDG